MKAYFNLHGTWVELNNETDFINGLKVSEFIKQLYDNCSKHPTCNDSGFYLENHVIAVQYNHDQYVTSFSNLILANEI